MKGCLTVIGIIAVLGIGGVWYMFRPMVLGVRYTPEDYASAKQKLGVTYENLSGVTGGNTLVVTGSHPVDTTFTSEELTALADNRYKQYAYFPFRNVVTRVHEDGSVEGSATVGFQDAVRYLLTLGVARKDIEEAAEKFAIPNTTLPVYLKASGSITDNVSSISVSGAKIANISVPGNLVDTYAPQFNALIDSVIASRKPSYSVDKLEVVNGAIHFKGASPDKEQAVQKL